jgi:hypothetical protein
LTDSDLDLFDKPKGGSHMSKLTSALAATAAVVAMTTAAAAQQQSNSQVGMLRCRTSASLGLIIGSHQQLACTFSPDNGPPETYSGYINRLGLDIGFTAGGLMAWGVIAHTAGVPRGALAGEYVGASGDIAIGLGVGGNALVGGTGRAFALQPLSVEGEVGVNLALGVAGLTLASQ